MISRETLNKFSRACLKIKSDFFAGIWKKPAGRKFNKVWTIANLSKKCLLQKKFKVKLFSGYGFLEWQPCHSSVMVLWVFQCNLPRVLPVTIYKYASCLIPYIVSFLILCGEWPSLVFKDFKSIMFLAKFFLNLC